MTVMKLKESFIIRDLNLPPFLLILVLLTRNKGRRNNWQFVFVKKYLYYSVNFICEKVSIVFVKEYQVFVSPQSSSSSSFETREGGTNCSETFNPGAMNLKQFRRPQTKRNKHIEHTLINLLIILNSVIVFKIAIIIKMTRFQSFKRWVSTKRSKHLGKAQNTT